MKVWTEESKIFQLILIFFKKILTISYSTATTIWTFWNRHKNFIQLFLLTLSKFFFFHSLLFFLPILYFYYIKLLFYFPFLYFYKIKSLCFYSNSLFLHVHACYHLLTIFYLVFHTPVTLTFFYFFYKPSKYYMYLHVLTKLVQLTFKNINNEVCNLYFNSMITQYVSGITYRAQTRVIQMYMCVISVKT